MEFSDTMPYDGDAEALRGWQVPLPPPPPPAAPEPESMPAVAAPAPEPPEPPEPVAPQQELDPTLVYQDNDDSVAHDAPETQIEPDDPTVAYETQAFEAPEDADAYAEAVSRAATFEANECGVAAASTVAPVMAATLAYNDGDGALVDVHSPPRASATCAATLAYDDEAIAAAVAEASAKEKFAMEAAAEAQATAAALAAQAEATAAALAKAEAAALTSAATAVSTAVGVSTSMPSQPTPPPARHQPVAVAVPVEAAHNAARGSDSMPPPMAVPAPKLQLGACVRLHGLRAVAELNGEEGVCCQWDEQRGRWIVRIARTGEERALKPENLEVLPQRRRSPVAERLPAAVPAPPASVGQATAAQPSLPRHDIGRASPAVAASLSPGQIDAAVASPAAPSHFAVSPTAAPANVGMAAASVSVSPGVPRPVGFASSTAASAAVASGAPRVGGASSSTAPAAAVAAPVPVPASTSPARRRLRGKQPVRPAADGAPAVSVAPARGKAKSKAGASRSSGSAAAGFARAAPAQAATARQKRPRPVPEVPPPLPGVAPEIGARVRVKGDGWGGGRGEYIATVTEADAMSFTVVIQKGSQWEETHVLREHCTLVQEGQGGARRRLS